MYKHIYTLAMAQNKYPLEHYFVINNLLLKKDYAKTAEIVETYKKNLTSLLNSLSDFLKMTFKSNKEIIIYGTSG